MKFLIIIGSSDSAVIHLKLYIMPFFLNKSLCILFIIVSYQKLYTRTL